MRYRDPCLLFEVDLPLGWTYDFVRSTLLIAEFHWWRDPERRLGIQAMGALAATDQSDEGWFRQLREVVSPPSLHPHSFTRIAGRTIALGQSPDSGEGIQHRFVYVRGERVDLAVHQREPHDGGQVHTDGFASLTPLLLRTLRTLAIPTDTHRPRAREFTEVASLHRDAFSAPQHGNIAASAAAARALIDACVDAFLAHVMIHALPPMGIPCMLADGNLLLWNAETSDAQLLKNANRLVARVNKTFEADLLHDLGSRKNVDELASLIAESEARLLQPEIQAGSPPVDDFERNRVHASWCRCKARERADEGDVSGEEEYLTRAVDDCVAALAVPSYSVLLPSKLCGALAAHALNPEQMSKLARAISRGPVMQQLRAALLGLLDLSFRTGDAAYQGEITALMMDVGEARVELALPMSARTGVGLAVISPDLWNSLVHDQTAHAYSLLTLGDGPNLEAAKKVLALADDRLRQLEAMTEAETPPELMPAAEQLALLRVRWCCANAKLHVALGAVQCASELVARGARELGGIVDETQRNETGQDLEELRLILSGDTSAFEALPHASDAQGNASPYQRLHDAFRAGNAATAALNAGNLSEAFRWLRAGLTTAVGVSPFNEQLPWLLLHAALVFERRLRENPELQDPIDLLGCAVSLYAAADAVDGARAGTTTSLARLSLGEARPARIIAEEMVRILGFALSSPEDALAAADRFRGRVLAQDLHTRVQKAPARPFTPEPAPTLTDEDDRIAIALAAGYVSNQASTALSARDEPRAMTGEEIVALVVELGISVVSIQPIGQRVALLIVTREGVKACRWSPCSLSAWQNAAESLLVRRQISPAARDEVDESCEPLDPKRRAPEGVLWDALFEPVVDLLRDETSVVIVPYRELALVPFGLLIDGTGRAAVDRYVLSLIPSLATLKTLHERAPWLRPIPKKAFIVGDPELDRTKRRRVEKQLPHAQAEASRLRERLLEAGMPDETVALRLFERATESSYRSDAAHSDLVHLACHAVVSPGCAASASYLVLATETPHDGLLMASEVPDVPLDDALVFLSACQSGQGLPTTDGVVGLGRAFLQAGARAVVMSLWHVHDRVSSAFAAHFYDLLLDSTLSRNAAEALREATLRTRADLDQGQLIDDNGPVPSTPGLWGAFTIIGDAQSIRFTPKHGAGS